MAKLYWRIKRNGKWTWVAATPENTMYMPQFNMHIYTGPEGESELNLIDDDPVDKPEVYIDE